MEMIAIPEHHLMINKANAADPVTVKAMILEHIPDLPDTFNTAITVMLGSDTPDIHANKQAENIDTFSEWIQSLFVMEFEASEITLILFYLEDSNIVRVIAGNLQVQMPIPEGSWQVPGQGPVEV